MADYKALRQCVTDFLEAQVLCKPEENRSVRDQQLLEHGRAFADVLLLHEGPVEVTPKEHEIRLMKLLRAATAINRDYDHRDLEAEALALFRKPR